MGVDICFYMEVKKREKWVPVVMQIPSELVEYKTREEKASTWYTQKSIYACRYYHFQDFLEDNATRGIPEDSEDVFRKELSDLEMGSGDFMFSDLCMYCEKLQKKLDKRLRASREHLLQLQLNRIEKAVTGKSQKIKRTNDANDYYCGMSSNAIKEDFDDEYCNIFWLRDTVRSIVQFTGCYAADVDIRILYQIC